MTTQEFIDVVDEKRHRALLRLQSGTMPIEDYTNYIAWLNLKETEVVTGRDSILAGASTVELLGLGFIGTFSDLVSGVEDIGAGAMTGFKSLGWIIPFLLVAVILLPVILTSVLKK